VAPDKSRYARIMTDPFALFQEWFADARQHAGIAEPTAMTLATATADGKPSARIVLLKQADDGGFVFFTNYEGRKSHELMANPEAALCFYWMPLERQIRIEGRVEKTSATESDAYFASRTRGKQIGAWASLQSQPLDDRHTLEARYQEIEARFAGQSVPRPPYWGGWRLVPRRVEFWHQGDFRLHDRWVFTRGADGDWTKHYLYP
jgi:pyridoxamine 5'-phosphate oxidase